MTGLEMENEPWSLANNMTGFSIVQALAFLYALGKTEFVLAVNKPIAWRLIHSSTLFISVGYCIAVFGCGFLAWNLGLSNGNLCVWIWITMGRVAAIVGFGWLILKVVNIQSPDWRKKCAENT